MSVVNYICDNCGETYSFETFKKIRFCTCGKLLTIIPERRPFEEVWQSILEHEGQTFETLEGSKFTYTIKGNVLKPRHTDRNIPRSHFERAYKLWPLDGPGKINDLQGPSYIWAILKKLG